MSELKKLGDFAVIGSGYAFSSDAFSEDGIPIIRMSDLCNGFVDIKHAARVSQTKGLDGFKLNQGDFLIGMSGSLDAYGVVGADVSTAYLNQRVGRLIIKDSKKAHYGFFAKVLSSDAYRKYVYREGIGAAQLNISSKQIECFEMFVPEYDIQKKIFQILDTIDTAIQQTQAIINKLKQLKQGLLHDLLTRGVDANGELRPCYEDAPHLYKESPLGWIPKEWEVVTLGEVSSLITDGTHQSVATVSMKSGNIPFLFVSCIREGVVAWDKSAFITLQDYQRISKGRKPEKGMILYTVVGSYGHAACISVLQNFAFQRHIACIYPKHELVVSSFISLVLNSESLRHYADKVALGNAQKTITLGELCVFPLVCPVFDEQNEIVFRVDALQAKLDKEVALLLKMQNQKTALMDDLLTGRIRVTSLLQTEASSV